MWEDKVMRKANRSFVLMTGVAALALVLAGCASTPEGDGKNPASAANSKDEKGWLAKALETSNPVIVPEGTVISVTLDQALSIEDNRTGDNFDASLSAPIVVDGKTVIPKGARAQGRIVESKASGRLKHPARMELTLTSIEVGGTRYDVDTSDTRSVGKSHKKRNLIFIGGGTGAGAVVGAIVGGGVGAAVGAAIGAGGGTAAAAATGKMQIRLPAETRLSFPLSQPLTIQVKG
jgi:outer membrane lipoprotein SlyB